MEIFKIMSRYNTQRKCIEYLEGLRWGKDPCCPYCGSMRSTAKTQEYRHTCNECGKSYSVLVGTIFESTKLSLPKWFAAICLILNAKKGVSSLQLSREIGRAHV
jgi:transposase-like protein